MSSHKSFDKYNSLLKEAFLEREAGLKELEELRARRVSENPSAKEESPVVEGNDSKPKHNEMPKKLPLSHTKFKELIGKVKVKPELLEINGIEHIGTIHDICQTENPRIFRFFGDRYISTVTFELSPPTLLDMKEIPDRIVSLRSHHQMRCQG